ncbi:MAG: GspE/PulE family protein [Sulfuricellaceae bacterium]|nr:GspE/PulE family protein [Sulfuricellaceae bacterium]
MARPQPVRLGDTLVQQHLITAEQLQFALDHQKRTGRKLGRTLVENGFVTEEQISGALAKQLNIPYINLKHFTVNPAVSSKIPETIARRYRAIVLEERENSFLVGLVDPSDLMTFDEISRLLPKELELAAVTEEQLLQTIDRIYRKTEEISDLAKELEQELGNTLIDFGSLMASPTVEDAPVVKLLQSMFEDAVQIKASDIHIEPQESRLQIRFRIDGVLHLQTEADMRIAPAVVVRLKLMSGLDISEKRLPQDGRINVKLKQQQLDVRVSTLPTQYGESIVMRLLSQQGAILDLERLGMPTGMLERYRHLIHRPTGMVLVTGPTGSGKTSTLYASLSELNSIESKILTVEDPVEYRLPGINQVQVNEKIELSFARVLRTFLRQDPDIILVGEMRDSETAQIGLRAAMTGHLVLSTLHTNDAISTPMRLLDMGVPSYMLASSLLAVIAQRLVRLICEYCAEPHTVQATELVWLENTMTENFQEYEFRHGRGCSRCNGTGYHGRKGVYEMLEITAPVAEAINRFDAVDFSRIALKQLGDNTLRHNIIDLVLSGRTTLYEAMRVSNQFDI